MFFGIIRVYTVVFSDPNLRSDFSEINIYSTELSGNIVLGNYSISNMYIQESTFGGINYGSSSIDTITVDGCSDITSFTIGSRVLNAVFVYNALSSLNVRNASSLDYLECVDNYNLKSLDLTGAAALVEADLEGNRLSSLNVKNNHNLTHLNIQYNLFKSFDLSQCPQVTHIYFGGNDFDTIDLTKLKNVNGLGVAGMGLTSLDKYKQYFAKLDDLDCSNNSLTELDLKKFPALTSLRCNGNMIADLNLSATPNLQRLYAGQNRFTKIDVSDLDDLRYFDISDSWIETLDITSCKRLKHITVSRTHLSELTLPKTLIAALTVDVEYSTIEKIDATGLDRVNIYAEETPLTDVISDDGAFVRVRGSHGVFIGDRSQVYISKLHTDFDYSKVYNVRNGTVSEDGIFTLKSTAVSGSYRYGDKNYVYNQIDIARGTLTVPDFSNATLKVTQLSDRQFKFSADTSRATFDYGYVCFLNDDTGEIIRKYPVLKARYVDKFIDLSNYDCSGVVVSLAACNTILGTEAWGTTKPQYFTTGKLSAPQNIKANTDGKQVTLSWDKVENATSYRVYRADSATGAKIQLKTVGTTSCTDTTVTAGKTYYYFVAAYDSKTGRLSAYSEAKSVKVQAAIAAPVITKITSNDTSVRIEWEAVAGATSYRVYRADSKTGAKALVKTVGTLYGTDTNVTAGKTYYYFVAAYDSKTGRLSAYSEAESIKV